MAENTNKKGQDIELRCDEVQEILTRPPRALVRWGITVFFGVLALIFVGGCFFKYPDVITAPVTVTTEHPPVWMVAHSSGKIKEVYLKDKDSVRTGQVIAVLENPAVTADIYQLKRELEDFCLTDSCIVSESFSDGLSLGNMQNAYAAFLKSITDYRNFLSLNLYEQKMASTHKELQEYRNYIKHLLRQAELAEEQTEISANMHRRDEILFKEGLTAKEEYEESKQDYLGRQQSMEQLNTSLSSARIQEAKLQQNLLEIQMESEREKNQLTVSLKAAHDELLTTIENWELTYLFTSPTNGILSYNNIWQKNQHVNSGDKVFSIVGESPGRIIGKIDLPITGSGKVAVGQRVNISISGFPYMEYGYLTGTVQSLSLLANENNAYTVTVSLPQDLKTSYGKELVFKGELSGTAEVMTDELSVTERLFSPLKYIWNKHL